MKKKLLTVLFLTTLCTLSTAPVFAEENVYSQKSEDVFGREQVQQWEEEILSEAMDTRPVDDPKNLFRAPVGGWTWRDGVICITDSYAKSPHFNNGHAGIVAAEPYYYATIESSPYSPEDPINGVRVELGDWTGRFPGTVYQYGVKKTTVAQDRAAAQWAAKQIGKPYNKSFTDIHTRKSFYCSQLVWAAYKDTAGVDIGTWHWGSAIHPFEFMKSSQTQLIYRSK